MNQLSQNLWRKKFKSQRDVARDERDSARDERDSARDERDSAMVECGELREEVEKMEENQNLQEDFICTLTHDLRNPVGAIKMAVDVLRYDESIKNSLQIVDLIDRNADLAMELITHLLDANQIKSGVELPIQRSECEILSVLQKCLESTTPKKQVNINILREDQREVWGYWDRQALGRAFGNLISNAIKYSDENSDIDIKVLQDSQVTTISFRNYGNTIPLEEQAKIFDSHFRANSKENDKLKGWGLGLTLVKGITESHKGRVEVTSSEAEGTIFSIRLPNASSAN